MCSNPHVQQPACAATRTKQKRTASACGRCRRAARPRSGARRAFVFQQLFLTQSRNSCQIVPIVPICSIFLQVLYLYRFTEGSMQRSTDFEASRRRSLRPYLKALPAAAHATIEAAVFPSRPGDGGVAAAPPRVRCQRRPLACRLARAPVFLPHPCASLVLSTPALRVRRALG